MRAFNNLTNDFQRLVAGRSIARDLDAVGINFYPAERAFQVKIYEPPQENTPVRETDAPLLRWPRLRDMIRCRTHGASTSDSRDYIALKNRSDENMTALFLALEAWHPGVSAIRNSLRTLSTLPVTDAPDQRFAALSTIALKQKPGQMPTLNLEWLLRRLPDPDQPGQDFRYDDATYLSALAAARSTPLVPLADALQRHWFAYEKSRALHLWLLLPSISAPDGLSALEDLPPRRRAQPFSCASCTFRASSCKRRQRPPPAQRICAHTANAPALRLRHFS